MKPSKNFYQWDINQKFTECDGRFVDFIINEKDIYRVDIVNGECIIPDEFLQTSGYHTVYECMSDYTIQNHMFPVHPREKPPAYVYTPTEKLTFEGLVQKVEDTVADIIHRADTGEFDGYTPVKGKDYFTEAEKNEMMESVSSGAIGEFREVVDSATADFNENSSVKTNDYNTNAEKKLDVYNSNDAEKLKAYNDNHVEKMTAYDANATDKLSTYNTNAGQKLESYNSNHTEKLTEYNANAENKTAEFDANAAALQTEVDRLRGECDQLAAENRKQENRIDALMKLNKGQTYDILPEEGETASRTAPSGSKYVGIDKVGGKSIVWNQLNNPADNINVKKGAIKLNEDGSITISGTVQDAGKYNELQISQSMTFMGNQKYLVRTNKIISICVNGHDKSTTDALLYTGKSDWTGFVALGVANGDEVNIEELVVQVYNLTQMFGAGNEPTIEQFKKLFVQKIYPYNSGEIISSRTATITAGAETITTGFPELKSAGTAHDEIDMDGGAIRRNVGTVDLGSLAWDHNGTFENGNVQFIARVPGRAYTGNGLCDRFEKSEDNALGTYTLRTTDDQIAFAAPEGTELNAFIESVNGATLYYELATPTTEQVTIPEPLQEWLPVEASGTVTFRNSDETKQLAVPNAVSWVRKLDEVN